LGVTYNGLGEHQNAVEALTKANALRKDWIIAINELGIAFRQLDNLKEAIWQFQRAVNLDGNFALGYYNLGEAFHKKGNKKEARKAQEKLRQLNPALAQQLENAIKGIAANEAKRQIRKRVPWLPF
jgi:superkiller protein 3